MFAHLTASAPDHDATMRPTLLSAGIHLTLVALAVLVTRGIVSSAPRPVSALSALYFPPAASTPPTGTSAPAAGHATALAPPLDIPSLPPAGLDIALPTISIPATGSQFSSGTPDSGKILSVVRGTDSHDAPWRADEVDEAVSGQRGPAPEYPRVLAQSGIAGEATLQYIVGADGAVEAASIVVIGASRPEFGVAATEAIRRAHFTPARRLGQPVRQLVRQLVRFALTAGN